MRVTRLLVALALGFSATLPTHASEQLGVVLLHGKTGLPQQLAPLAAILQAQDWLTEQPEMCWARERIYDRPYLECLREIDAAVGKLRERGATAIVVLGMSLGGNGALGYGANYPGLKGIVTLAPAHAPEFISRQPEIAAALERARALIAEGKGDVRVVFPDRNTRVASFPITVNATPTVYLSFLSPDSPAVLPANAARLNVPLLYIAPSNDPTQRGRAYIYDRVPANPLNRYITVNSDHFSTPALSGQIVTNWLRELMAP